MEVPGLAHNITSPLSPCEGMIKDLSLDAIQLCERDGKESQCGVETFARIVGALGPIVNFQEPLQHIQRVLSLVSAC